VAGNPCTTAAGNERLYSDAAQQETLLQRAAGAKNENLGQSGGMVGLFCFVALGVFGAGVYRHRRRGAREVNAFSDPSSTHLVHDVDIESGEDSPIAIE